LIMAAWQFDESICLSRLHWHDGMPPTLYLDDYTVLREVCDLCDLRCGDRCIVGLNVLRKLSARCDWLCLRLTSWEMLPMRLYHHFVLVDDVHAIDPRAGPVNEHGAPVRIAEYSDTAAGAWRRLTANGHGVRELCSALLDIVRHPARFRLLELHDYVAPSASGSGAPGLFVVCEERTTEQRVQAAEAALAFARDADQPGYSLIRHNCEHAANMFTSNSKRCVSPQVPVFAWNAFRFALQLVGVLMLALLSCLPDDYSRMHAAVATCYHFLSTVPVSLQLVVKLVRTSVNLTHRRGVLGQAAARSACERKHQGAHA